MIFIARRIKITFAREPYILKKYLNVLTGVQTILTGTFNKDAIKLAL